MQAVWLSIAICCCSVGLIIQTIRMAYVQRQLEEHQRLISALMQPNRSMTTLVEAATFAKLEVGHDDPRN